jgi:hypothetical protein
MLKITKSKNVQNFNDFDEKRSFRRKNLKSTRLVQASSSNTEFVNMIITNINFNVEECGPE